MKAFSILLLLSIFLVSFVLAFQKNTLDGRINGFSSKKFTNRFSNKTPSENLQSTNALRVSGKKIVDENDQEVQLRGFQGIQFYPISQDTYLKSVEAGADPYAFDDYALDLSQYRITDFDVQEIQSTGANVVRVWMNLSDIQKKPYEYSDKTIGLLENIVNTFGEQGIYTVLVLGGTGQNTNRDSQIYTSKGLSLWDKSNGLWDQSVKLWGVVAKRLSANAYVAGYDIINEPAAPSKRALHDFYQDAIDEIRAFDANHIIFLETDSMKEREYQIGGTYTDSNIAASIHFYYPSNFTLPGGTENMIPGLTYPGKYCHRGSGTSCARDWNKAMLTQIFDTALNLDELQDKPLYVGEFGASAIRDDSGALQWTTDVLSIMNEKGLHYTYHNYTHQSQYGYYWLMKPEVKQMTEKLLSGLAGGSLKYEDITSEQKQMFTTERGYTQRNGIKEILTSAFSFGGR